MRNKLLGGKPIDCDRFGHPKKEQDRKDQKDRVDRRGVRTKDWWAE